MLRSGARCHGGVRGAAVGCAACLGVLARAARRPERRAIRHRRPPARAGCGAPAPASPPDRAPRETTAHPIGGVRGAAVGCAACLGVLARAARRPERRAIRHRRPPARAGCGAPAPASHPRPRTPSDDRAPHRWGAGCRGGVRGPAVGCAVPGRVRGAAVGCAVMPSPDRAPRETTAHPIGGVRGPAVGCAVPGRVRGAAVGCAVMPCTPTAHPVRRRRTPSVGCAVLRSGCAMPGGVRGARRGARCPGGVRGAPAGARPPWLPDWPPARSLQGHTG